eukprot:TRINITY_DN13096_c0_g2_i3.p1 TRINITY_DN13096_c0_g2~~TRINITY_DN13096_c0_g2_i3.p1  ORF type:complete len:269 (+),score=43.20 TRINITY_DN13096_c0_g2_i3:579-1385(+)
MKYLETQFVLLVQYIPSLNFSELGTETYEALFDISKASGRERMIDIGRILATDSFFNFPLRFPLLWSISKTKALDNAILELTPNSQEPVGNLFLLNTRCHSFAAAHVPHAMMVGYLNAMEQFITRVFRDCRAAMRGSVDVSAYEFESLKGVKDFLMRQCRIEGVTCLEIVFGIIIGYYNIVNMGTERVERVLNWVKGLAIVENKEEWNRQMIDSINMKYLREAYDLIDHHLRLYLDEISWVLKITNNFKVIFESVSYTHLTLPTNREV